MVASFHSPISTSLPSAMAHLLDLPEIKRHIAQFLTPRELTICSRVSQDWNQTCRPLIWRQLSIIRHSPLGRVLYKHSIRRHSHHVKTLHYSYFDGSMLEYTITGVQDVYFQILKELRMKGPSPDLATFIHRHHLTLVYLDLHFVCGRSEKGQRESNELWSAIATCPLLETLQVDRISVTHATWSLCWDLWSRLSRLHLRHVEFSPLLDAGAFDGPKNSLPQGHPSTLPEWLAEASPCRRPLGIKTLSVHSNQNTRQDIELSLLRYCPDLETLIWFAKDSKALGPHLAEQTQHCPKLVNVTVSFGSRTEDVAPFLEKRVGLPLQRLGLPFGFFSQAACDQVRIKYASTLRSLNVMNTVTDSGRIAQEILCTLPALETLSMRYLTDLQIVNDPRPTWACLGLQLLTLGISVVGEDALEGQRLIMSRLGTLRSLTYLFVYVGSGDAKGLNFRLIAGLGQLATLQKLRELKLESQQLTEEDVQWMVDSWPRLESVFGTLHPEEAMDSFLKTILTDRGITTRAISYDVQVL